MKDIVVHLSVEDAEADALIEALATVVDDEDDHGQWTLIGIGMPEAGMGGALPPRLPVRIDAFGVGHV